VQLTNAAGPNRRWPTAIDVFCGVGGLSLGLRRAHFRVAAAIDVLPLAVESYRMNFPRVPVLLGDVREPDTASKLLRAASLREGELDLLAGCPPCQGFSAIRTKGRGAAVEDDRNDLVVDFLRLVRELQPRCVLMENVPGLAGAGLFREFTDGIMDCGYLYDSKVLDSADFGTPQQRRRLVLVAARGEKPGVAGGDAERRTVRDAIGGLAGRAGRSGDPLHDHGEQRAERVRAVIAAIPRDGGSRADLPDNEQLECHRRAALHGYGWGRNIYARMTWDGLAPTITGGCINPSKGRFLHPEEDRAITVREALLLQGFPANHRVSLRRGKYAAAELAGNAIPPGFVEVQARILRRMPTLATGAAA
jgi:DNA (cytosine-5)-methyltransferase 1